MPSCSNKLSLALACVLAALIPGRVALSAPTAGTLASRPADGAPLDSSTLERWTAACRSEAEQVVPTTPEQLGRLRQRADASLGAFVRALSESRLSATGWSAFLQLQDAQALVGGQEISAAQADVLDARWHNAPSLWQHPLLRRAAVDIQALIAASRRQGEPVMAEIRSSWLRAAELIAAYPAASVGDLAELEALLGKLASIYPEHRVLVDIERELSGPNLIVHVPTRWLESRLNDEVFEPYQINGVYAGARTTGSGVLQGSVSCRVISRGDHAELALLFSGTSNSRTSGSSGGVRVRSRATTTFHAEKRFTLSAHGISPEPAAATVAARVAYENVSASGGPIRRQRSIESAYGRRGQAQRDTEAAVRRSVVQRLDEQGNQWAQDLNREVARLRRDAAVLPKTMFAVELRASQDALRWEARLARVGQMPITPPPPPLRSGDSISLQVAASAIEQRSNAILESDSFSPALLRRALGAGETTTASPNDQDFSGTLPPAPFKLRFIDDGVIAELQLEKFEAAGARYPRMSVALDYHIGLEGGAVVFERDARPKATVFSSAEGAASSTGRATTLRIGVERRLDRAIDRRFEWAGIDVNVGDSESKQTPIAVRTDGQWLGVAYSDQAPSPAAHPRENVAGASR